MMLFCKECLQDYFEGELEEWRCPECKEICYPIEMEFDKEDRYILPLENLPPFRFEWTGRDPEIVVGVDNGMGGAWAVSGEKAQFNIQALLQHAATFHHETDEDAQDIDDMDDVLNHLRDRVQFILSQAVRMGWYINVPKDHIDRLDELDSDRRQGKC